MKLKITILKTAVLAVCTYGSVVAQDINKPLAHYYFEQNTTNSGTLGSSADLEVFSGTATYAASSTPGNYAFDCNGENTLTTGASGWQGITGSKARTITAWIYVPEEGYSTSTAIISMGSTQDGKRFTLRYYGGGLRLEVQHVGTTHNVLAPEKYGGTNPGAGTLTKNAWQFVAITMPDGGLLEDVVFYIGDQKFTNAPGTLTHPIDTGSGPVLIGSQTTADSNAYLPFFSKIDGLRVYDFQATDAQIEQIKALKTLSAVSQTFAANELSVYPNAVTDYLNIASADTNNFDVLVFDMLGKVVTKANVSNRLDMSILETGLYIVKVRSGNKVSSFKIAKK